ncbi:MAG: hypothetical protein JNJ58_10740 [Chitinophagaceae bacterium]|nr:hypothetical protein [Chitinophagaceae bacterium]
MTNRKTAYNRIYKKLAVQGSIESLCPPQADTLAANSLMLRNRQLFEVEIR